MTIRLGVTKALAFLALLLCCGAVMAGIPASTTDTQDLEWFAGGPPMDGKSHLTRTDTTIFIVVEAAGLVPGDVHTLWWIVFNDPGMCSAPGCGEDDIFNEDGSLNVDGVIAAGIGIGNASGNVAKPDGTLEFGGNLTADGHQLLFPAGLDGNSVLSGLPEDVEVHVIVQTHGQARGGPQLGRQLSMVDFGCTPACGDIQFAAHRP